MSHKQETISYHHKRDLKASQLPHLFNNGQGVLYTVSVPQQKKMLREAL